MLTAASKNTRRAKFDPIAVMNDRDLLLKMKETKETKEPDVSINRAVGHRVRHRKWQTRGTSVEIRALATNASSRRWQRETSRRDKFE